MKTRSLRTRTLAALAAVLAFIFQDGSVQIVFDAMTNGFTSQTGVEQVDRLLSRGGMMGMMGVTLIAFCAFGFAGIVQRAGMLNVILDRLLNVIRSTGTLIASAAAGSVVVAFITGNSFLAIIVPGELFAPAFKQRRLAAKNLSRTLEDSGTVVVPLVPWSIAGVFMAGTLGGDTVAYAGWAVMCYCGFVFALVFGFTGIGIARRTREDETIPGS